jgi:hypothetical protein
MDWDKLRIRARFAHPDETLPVPRPPSPKRGKRQKRKQRRGAGYGPGVDFTTYRRPGTGTDNAPGA